MERPLIRCGFTVKGAKSKEEAKTASKALSNSLCSKDCSLWRRSKIGGELHLLLELWVECSEESLEIYYDDSLIYSKDKRELDQETEERAYQIMKQDSFKIVCDLGVGEAEFTSFGCDLSYEYVKINAEYRT